MTTPFSHIIITASNPTQLRLYSLEVAALVSALNTKILTVCDPQGHRVGSGGGTTNALLAAAAEHGPDVLGPDSRVLILHSGGDSQRAPLCTVQGKAFSSLPQQATTTPLSLLLDVLQQVTPSPGVLVSSTDVILHMPDLEPTLLPENCVAGLGIYSPLEYGTRHGVFTSTEILQKPSFEQLRSRGLTDEVLLDSGVVFLGHAVCRALLALSAEPPYSGSTFAGLDRGDTPFRFELYTDVLQACPPFCKDPGSGLGRALAPFTFRVIPAPRSSVFVHSGTTAELLQLSTKPPPFCVSRLVEGSVSKTSQRSVSDAPAHVYQVGFRRRVASLVLPSGQHVDESAVLVNSLLRGDARAEVGPGALIEHCDLSGPYKVGRGAVCSRLSLAPGVYVPDACCLQQIQVGPRAFVFPCFGVTDSVKDLDGTFMNREWAFWAVLGDDNVWAPSTSVRNLWTAKIFPIVDPHDPEQLDAALMLLTMAHSNGWIDQGVRDVWLRLERLGLCDLATRFDPEAFFAHRREFMPALIERKAWANALPVERCNKAGVEAAETLIRRFQNEPAGLARACSLMADALGGESAGHHEARNATFWKAFDQGVLHVLALTPSFSSCALDRQRLAAHYEALSSKMVGRALVVVAGEDAGLGQEPPPEGWVHASCPARVDLGGGWSDTPPITFEHGGAVSNLAVLVDGKRPMGASGRLIPNTPPDHRMVRLWLGKWQDAGGDACCEVREGGLGQGEGDFRGKWGLLKCVLLAVAGGESSLWRALGPWTSLELCAWSDLPVGSGLGGSSIVAAALCAVVGRLLGVRGTDRKWVVEVVLRVEQMLGSGGGWQDQIGGVYGGLKLGRCARGKWTGRLDVDEIALDREQDVTQRMVLVFMGKARLARNLLQVVLKRWHRREDAMCAAVDQLVGNAERVAEALRQNDWPRVADELNLYWRLKKAIAGDGVETEEVKRVWSRVGDLCLGYCLCGAGGGGFGVLVLKEGALVDDVRGRLQSVEGVEVKQVQADLEGMHVWGGDHSGEAPGR